MQIEARHSSLSGNYLLNGSTVPYTLEYCPSGLTNVRTQGLSTADHDAIHGIQAADTTGTVKFGSQEGQKLRATSVAVFASSLSRIRLWLLP